MALTDQSTRPGELALQPPPPLDHKKFEARQFQLRSRDLVNVPKRYEKREHKEQRAQQRQSEERVAIEFSK